MRLPIDGQAAKALTNAGLTWLKTNQELVNALNVYPIPDGDTGTNMVLTMQNAYDEVKNSAERNIGKMVQLLAHGALMGAPGNSGVILSQIWRGFARALDDAPVLDGPLIVQGFAEARNTAYRGVIKPVEGTILTVAKDIAFAAEKALETTDHPVLILEEVVKAAEESVNRTPDLLPVLKKAGVVDAGGMGLFLIFEGMMRHINGDSLQTPVIPVRPLHEFQFEETMEEIEEGQDVEVVIDFIPEDGKVNQDFFDALDGLGTSIQIGEGDGMYRVHIHVPEENQFEPIHLVNKIGKWTNISMENLVLQMEELNRQSAAKKIELPPVMAGEIASLVVAPGYGIAKVFAGLDAAGIIEGGQTMNPAVKDILSAIEDVPTDKVIILPNNKNIIMSAREAAGLTIKDVAVIPSRTVPQGIEAMLKFKADGDFDTVVERMTSALDGVVSAEITTSSRDAEMDGIEVKEGQIFGLLYEGGNGQMVCATEDLIDSVICVLSTARAEDCELLTMFTGDNVSEGEVEGVTAKIEATFPDLEIEVQDGGQPHYQFIMMIE